MEAQHIHFFYVRAKLDYGMFLLCLVQKQAAGIFLNRFVKMLMDDTMNGDAGSSAYTPCLAAL